MADDDAQNGGQEPQGDDGREPEEQQGQEPEGSGEVLDLQRAKAKIAKANREAESLRRRLKEFEDRDKSETEKLTDAKEQAAKDAADAKSEVIRLRMAIKYGLDEDDLDLLGTGDEEAIEKRAKRLAERSGSSGDDAPRRPRERLRTGATSSTEPDKNDPKKLAADVPRGW